MSALHKEIFSKEQFFSDHVKHYFNQSQYLIPENEFKKLIDILLMVGIKLSLMPIRVDNFLNRYDYFYDSYKHEYPDRAEKIDGILLKFSEETGLNYFLYRSEIVFYAYVHVLGMRNERQIKIGIYSDMGKSHTISMVEEMKRYFSNHTILPYHQESNFDFIITTTDLKFEIDLMNQKYIVVSDYIQNVDILKIRQELKLLAKTR